MSKPMWATAATLVVGVMVIAPPVRDQEAGRSEQEAEKTYPDFALQVPPVNTSPGLEYASRTRVFQGIPGIERTAKGDRKSTRLNSSHIQKSRMPSSA